MRLIVQSALDSIVIQVKTFQYPDTPPWTYNPLKINLTLAKSKKDATDPMEFLDRYYEIKGKCRGYKSVYNDGSQSDHQAAAAAVMDKKVYSERLPDC